MARTLTALRSLTSAARFATSLFRRAGKTGPVSEPLFEALEERTLLAADITATLTVPAATGLASAGGALTGSILLANTGNATATGFTYRIYLSTDTVIGNEDDVQLTGEAGLTATLAASGTTTVNLSAFTVPTDMRPGSYFVITVLDTANVVAEGETGEANNTVWTSSPVITLNGPAAGTANLNATVTFTAQTISPDQHISVPTTVRNTGAAAATTFHVTWVLSTNSVIGDADDIAIDDEVIDSLAAGGTVTFDRDIQLPVGIALGAYRIGVWVDDRGDVAESNESDNRAITTSAGLNIALPDLTATLTSSVATVAPGGFFTGTLQVRNNTLASAVPFSVHISLSTDNVAGNEDDIFLMSVSIEDLADDSLGLAGGATRSITGLRVYIPYGNGSGGALAPGAYRIVLTVDAMSEVEESNEGNNRTITANTPLTIPARNTANDPAGADLFTFAYPITGSYQPGQTFTAAAIFGNLGNATAADGIIWSAYLSTNATFDENDVLLEGDILDSVSTFGVGSMYVTGRFTIPGEAPTGTFYVIFRADPGNVIDETNDGNNTASAGTATVTRGTVSITATDAAAAEVATGTANGAVFRIARTGSTASDLVVNYTVTGTAGESDYNAGTFTGTVTIPAGSTFVLINLTVNDDALAENDETVILTIDENDFYIVSGTQSAATATIADNEARVSITAPDAAAGESSGTANPGQFRLTRTGSTAQALTVAFDIGGTAGAADYSVLSTVAGANLVFDAETGTGTITFPAGQSTVTFNVNVTQDAIAEESETVIVSVQAGENNSVNLSAYRATVTIADDEPIVTITAPDAAAGEVATGAANPGQFRVTRTGSTAEALVVNYTVSGTATSGSDYADTLTGTVTIPAGATFAVFNVTVIDDALAETPETVIVTLDEDEAYRLSTTESQQFATVTIADNEPTVTITASDAAAAEIASGTANPGQFRVTRTGSTAADLVVHYTLSGTATSGDDFNATLIGTVTILAGQTSAVINVTVIDDALAENAETVIVTLDADNAYNLSTTQSQRTATVNITDNEPIVTIAVVDAAAAEVQSGTANGASFRVSRPTTNTAGDLIVHYTLSGTATNGDDYNLSGTVTILAGQATALINLAVLDDFIAESPETVIVTLAADDAYRLSTTASQRTATATIADNEPIVSLIATDTTASEVPDGGTPNNGNFRVSRTGDLSQQLTVNVIVSGTAVNGDWINFVGAELVIPAGQAFYDNPVIVVDDSLWENPETIIITLQTGDGYHLTSTASQRTATVTITDNENTISITAADRGGAEVVTGTANPMSFRVARTGGTNTQPVTVFFSLAGTGTFDDDFTFSSPVAGTNISYDENTGIGEITIPAGAANVTFFANVVDDALAESSETVTINLTADPSYRLSLTTSQRTATGNIADNESTVSITASDAAAAEVTTGTLNPGQFRIARTAGSNTAALTVNFSVSGSGLSPDDFGLVSGIAGANLTFDANTGVGTITIPAGAANVTFAVNVVDDLLAENIENVVVTLVADASYRITTTVAQQSAIVKITDNEPTVTIAARDAAAAEVFGGGTANRGTYRITRTGGTTAALVVNYTVSGTGTLGDDYTGLAAGTVTIPIGAAFVDVNIDVLDDVIVEGNETVIVTLAADSAYRLSTTPSQQFATVNIADNEPTFAATASDAAAAEGATNTGNFRITRTGGNSQITVVYFSLTGTATAGVDFTLSSTTPGASLTFNTETGLGTVTFTGTTTQVNIVLTALVDVDNEGSETAVLTILAAQDEGDQAYTIGGTPATVNIANVAPLP